MSRTPSALRRSASRHMGAMTSSRRPNRRSDSWPHERAAGDGEVATDPGWSPPPRMVRRPALESPYSPPANRPGNRYTSEPAAAGGEDSGLESAARGQPQEEVADFAADGSHRHTEVTGDGLVFEAVAEELEDEQFLRADRARPAVDVGDVAGVEPKTIEKVMEGAHERAFVNKERGAVVATVNDHRGDAVDDGELAGRGGRSAH